MYIVLTIFLISLVITIHEAGHAVEMMKLGLPIRRFVIGIPLPKVPHLAMRIPKLYFGVELHPLLFGGFVEMTAPGAYASEIIPVKSQFAINGGGIMANLISAILFCAVAMVCVGWWGSALLNVGANVNTWWLATSLTLLALLVYLLREFLVFLILPVGLATLVLLAYTFTLDPVNAIAGPVTMVQMTGDVVVRANGSMSAISDLFLWAGLLSVSIGLLNALPLFPLDGGRMVSTLLRRVNLNQKLMTIYEHLGAVATLFLIIVAIGSDLFHLFVD